MELECDWLDLPLKTSDLELNKACQERLDQVLRLAESGSPITLRLRQLLLSRTTEMPTLEDAAREFGVSPRTLARQLQKDGYSYRHLTEELRKELAQSWLRSADMTAKEVSYRLGFSDVGAFRRAFKSWTGCTIGEYCKAASTPA
ncbi:putative HTH-type transcriptional regulator [compost metagenome]